MNREKNENGEYGLCLTLEDMLRSADKISGVKATDIYFGHGRLEPLYKVIVHCSLKEEL
jgi:hypothetical protein